MGFATVGVVGLYRTTRGALTADSVSTALSLARAVTVPAVREALRRAAENGEPGTTDTNPGLRREVHQATGVLSVRLSVSISEAFARLRAFAISSERSITAVSRDIIDGTIDARDFD
jgi:AmiR/NasT family two-component response regulator